MTRESEGGRGMCTFISTGGVCAVYASVPFFGMLCTQKVKGKTGPSQSGDKMVLVHVEICKP